MEGMSERKGGVELGDRESGGVSEGGRAKGLVRGERIDICYP